MRDDFLSAQRGMRFDIGSVTCCVMVVVRLQGELAISAAAAARRGRMQINGGRPHSNGDMKWLKVSADEQV